MLSKPAYRQQCSDERAERFSCMHHECSLQNVASPIHTASPSAFHAPLNSAVHAADVDGQL